MKNLQIYDEYTISPPSKEHDPSIDCVFQTKPATVVSHGVV